MSRLTGTILGLTFVLTIVALVFALWPVVTEAPWEDGITEAELFQILELATQITQEEEEAARLERCAYIFNLMKGNTGDMSGGTGAEILGRLLDDSCL